jgi:pyruvate dehydrogenase E2 component (dihydrolipoamide acetyltransferase)/2-oxoisovalerate dehydrogenase E2 component (dihydrolipoyl transacylase)
MEFRLPEIGEGVYEAELVSWLVKPGDPVKRGQNIMEVLTDKATMEIPSPFTGTVGSLQAEPGQSIKVGQVVLSYTAAGQKEEPAVSAAAPPAEAPLQETVPARKATVVAVSGAGGNGPVFSETRSGLPVQAAPSVRYLAHKLGIDLARVRGTGPGGRILVGDLTPYLSRPQPSAGQATPEPRPDYGTPGARIKLQGIRRKIADHMVLSKRTIPHYSYVDECDVTEMVRLRDGVREAYQQAGVKLTYLAFIVKAVTAALKDVPIMNATLDEAQGQIVLHDRYHIGVAVATPAGLIVPVIHDADRKELGQVAQEIERLSTQARAGKVKLDDLRGGTFTVTSVGNIGGLFSSPVINHPEVGILGVGKIVRRPVFDDHGQVKPADMVYLSFSFDHRVIDGAVGAAFGNAVVKRLQNPAALLLPTQLV